MIKLQEKEDNIGIITCKGVGLLANAIRQTLLDGIENIAFDLSEANLFGTTDRRVLHHIFINIQNCKVYEEGEFYIKFTNINKDEMEPVMSDHIMNKTTKQPAKVESGVLLCHLHPGCLLKVNNIKTHRGYGRDHVKFAKSVVGPVEYRELDYMYIRYLNERGFIEQNRRRVKVKDMEKLKEFKGTDKKYLIWNKTYAEKINEKDRKYAEDHIKISSDIKIDKSIAEDYEIIFKTFSDNNPKDILKLAFNELIKRPNLEALRYFIWKEQECPIIINNNELIINHPAAEKLRKTAEKKISEILKL